MEQNLRMGGVTMAACIDCGRPSVSGSPYCQGCNEPIYVGPREMMQQIKAEMEAEK